MRPTKPPIFLAILVLLSAMTFIQLGASLAKQLFPIIGPGGTVALRTGLSSVILLLIFRPWHLRPSLMQWRAMLVYGVSLGGMQLAFYFAIERIPLGIGVALEFSGPLLIAFLSSKRKRDLIWVALAILGIFLLLPDLTGASALDPIGIALALTAGGCWGAYIWFGQRAGSIGSGGKAVAIGMSIATLWVFPTGVALSTGSVFTWSILPLALCIAILSSAVPYCLEMVALKRLSTQHFSVLMSLDPALGALTGLIILQEQLSLAQWIAIAMVIIASMGSTLSTKR